MYFYYMTNPFQYNFFIRLWKEIDGIFINNCSKTQYKNWEINREGRFKCHWRLIILYLFFYFKFLYSILYIIKQHNACYLLYIPDNFECVFLQYKHIYANLRKQIQKYFYPEWKMVYKLFFLLNFCIIKYKIHIYMQVGTSVYIKYFGMMAIQTGTFLRMYIKKYFIFSIFLYEFHYGLFLAHMSCTILFLNVLKILSFLFS